MALMERPDGPEAEMNVGYPLIDIASKHEVFFMWVQSSLPCAIRAYRGLLFQEFRLQWISAVVQRDYDVLLTKQAVFLD